MEKTVNEFMNEHAEEIMKLTIYYQRNVYTEKVIEFIENRTTVFLSVIDYLIEIFLRKKIEKY